MKNYLLIVNPISGRMKINRYIDDIVNIFTEKDIMTTIIKTNYAGEAKEIAYKNASKYDAIICAGGDGTYNETISGIIESKEDILVGYIPCGSTNDFAYSLGLPKDYIESAKLIAAGNYTYFDVGLFNDRVFSYVASCGAFTEASYDTPQKLKNAVGHLAYVLNGATKLNTIKPINLKVVVDNRDEYEGEYIFCSVSNSKSLAGLVKLKSKDIDLSDGKLELTLVKKPKDVLEFNKILKMLSSHKIDDTSLITFLKGENFMISAPKECDWTLDGECEKGATNIDIAVVHNAIKLLSK